MIPIVDGWTLLGMGDAKSKNLSVKGALPGAHLSQLVAVDDNCRLFVHHAECPILAESHQWCR